MYLTFLGTIPDIHYSVKIKEYFVTYSDCTVSVCKSTALMEVLCYSALNMVAQSKYVTK